jgi:HlyD family secretion protein
MKRRTLIIIASAIVVAAGAAVLMATLGDKKKPTEVQLAIAKKAKIVQKVNATGKIQPKTQVKISADVSAKITRLDVKEGDAVKKGQFLVELDRERSVATVESQEATVRSAQSNAKLIHENVLQTERVLKRSRELFAKKLESQSSLDTAEANYQVELARYQSALDQVEQSKGLLKQAKDGLSKTMIYAPMSGTISVLNKEVGEIVIGSQFQPDIIMVVAELGNMEALVNVDESDITGIKLGQPAEIEVDALLHEEITGVITEIASSARVPKTGEVPTQKTEFEVKIGVTSAVDKLRPGMTASADIVTDTRESALSVPLQSVTVRTLEQLQEGEKTTEAYTAGKDGFVQIVWVAKDGKVTAKQVKTGIQSGEFIEILDGLKEGDEVVSGSYRAISRDLNNGNMVVKEVVDKNKDKNKAKNNGAN